MDGYEPVFGWPIDEWAASEYHVDVTLPGDFEAGKDLFYFCHIHRYLGGRIKLMKGGTIINPLHLPAVTLLPPPPSSYDEHCGTYGLVHDGTDQGWGGDSWPHSMVGDHRLPHPECPHTFVCEEDKSTFASCLDAINCHMFNGMTTYERNDEKVLFIHQMIPHHQNAVNMAKSLLKHWDYQCDDLGTDSNECIMENIIRSIINGQNAQIQTMRDLLVSWDADEFDDCDVPMKGSEIGPAKEGYVYGPWYGWVDDGYESDSKGERKLNANKTKKVEKASSGNVHRGLGEFLFGTSVWIHLNIFSFVCQRLPSNLCRRRWHLPC